MFFLERKNQRTFELCGLVKGGECWWDRQAGDARPGCGVRGGEWWQVRTYIASGNVVFRAAGSEGDIRRALAARLQAYAGRPIGVLVRTEGEIADVAARNPFKDAPGNRVMVLFTDSALPADPLDGLTGQRDERIALGTREMFILYPVGMADTRLRLPAGKTGTARNMNTVAKLAEMASGLMR